MTADDTHISEPGAFLQVIEYRTTQPDRMQMIIDDWAAAIGADRTTRWYLTTTDRDQPDTYLQLVEFPSYEVAMANSQHPATRKFADALNDIAHDVEFRNLEVTAAARL
jgi:hypothetical protein